MVERALMIGLISYTIKEPKLTNAQNHWLIGCSDKSKAEGLLFLAQGGGALSAVTLGQC